MEESNSLYHLGLIAKYLKNELSEFEKNLLLEWIDESAVNKRFFIQTKKAWEITAQDTSEFKTDVDLAWKKVRFKLEGLQASQEDQFEKQDTAVVQFKKEGYTWIKYAASIALLIGLSFFFYTYLAKDKLIEVITMENEKKEFYLPDSSKIWLKENSKFSYAADFKEKRFVKLEGEAYFEVKKFKNKPFSISSLRAITEVLGTSFDIKSNKNDSIDQVEVYTGKVSVEYKEKGKASRKFLQPGMKAQIGKGEEIKVQQFATVNALAWKEDKLVFDNTGMNEVVEALQRYFNIRIKMDSNSLTACRFTGTFDQPSLSEIQEVLAVSSNIILTKKQDLYILSGQGCK